MERSLGRRLTAPEWKTPGKIDRRGVMIGLIIGTLGMSTSNDHAQQARSQRENFSCPTPRTPLVLETNDATTEERIAKIQQRLPNYLVYLVNQHYRTIVLPDSQAISTRYPLQTRSELDGYIDRKQREIVVESRLSGLMHEIGHATDFILGDLSLRNDFLVDILPEYIENIMNQNRGWDYDWSAFLKSVSVSARFPLLNRRFIGNDKNMYGFVCHAFVYGFESYYSEDEEKRTICQDKFPKLFNYFDKLDQDLRNVCV